MEFFIKKTAEGLPFFIDWRSFVLRADLEEVGDREDDDVQEKYDGDDDVAHQLTDVGEVDVARKRDDEDDDHAQCVSDDGVDEQVPRAPQSAFAVVVDVGEAADEQDAKSRAPEEIGVEAGELQRTQKP